MIGNTIPEITEEKKECSGMVLWEYLKNCLGGEVKVSEVARCK
jgi:hypothetical protein